jgi:hypothetical protein
MKPALNEENKKSWLQFCLSMIDLVSAFSNVPRFLNMFNAVHIDKKWFFMTKIVQKHYLLTSEEELHRSVKSKRFVVKVMFFVVVVRSRFNEAGEVIFNGKLGIFPFIIKKRVQRSSRSQPVGTLVTKAMILITKEEY